MDSWWGCGIPVEFEKVIQPYAHDAINQSLFPRLLLIRLCLSEKSFCQAANQRKWPSPGSALPLLCLPEESPVCSFAGGLLKL